MSFQSLPSNLDMSKLHLDCQLVAVPIKAKGNTFRNLMGIDTWSVGMYTQNIGFGILSVDIETKASLQPVITIKFKDLFGNTVFGNQTGQGNSNIDYSLLFDWPPPKFKLTIKGFLGRSVCLILNLLKTVTRYNSSDGSYEITCTFLPNLYGFLSDIPYLYLYAIPGLKKQSSGGVTTSDRIQSVFQLGEVGKEYQEALTYVSRDYDVVKEQLGLLLSGYDNALSLFQKTSSQLYISNGSTLKNTSITLILPPSLNTGTNKSGDDIDTRIQIALSNKSYGDVEYNKILAILGNIGSTNINSNIDIKYLTIIGSYLPNYYQNTTNNSQVQAAKLSSDDILKAMQPFIDKGKTLLNEGYETIKQKINKSVGSKLEGKLSFLTISNVFSTLAADGAYILGSILKAGYHGYITNQSARDNKGSLIGSYYPLRVDDEGEQVPDDSPQIGINNKGCEMDFVLNFIDAISKGIIENPNTSTSASVPTPTFQYPINGLEAASANPYVGSNSAYQIIENLLLRSGILINITNAKSVRFSTNDVDNEITNITQDILTQLSSFDLQILKDFINIFDSFIDHNGQYISDSLKDTTTQTNLTSKQLGALSSSDIVKLTLNRFPFQTVGSFFLQYCPNLFYNEIKNSDRRFAHQIDFQTFTSDGIFYNGFTWLKPQHINVKGTQPLFYIGITDTSTQQNFAVLKLIPYAHDDPKLLDYIDQKLVINYTKINTIPNQNQDILLKHSDIGSSNVMLIQYSDLANINSIIWNLFGDNTYGEPQRAFVWQVLNKLHPKTIDVLTKTMESEKHIKTEALEHANAIYIQMHNIFNQYSIMGTDFDNKSDVIDITTSYRDDLPTYLEELYGRFIQYDNEGKNDAKMKKVGEALSIDKNLAFTPNITDGQTGISMGFRYDYPAERINPPINGRKYTNVANSIINVEALYKPNANTTLLNLIQQICTKNSFNFIVIPGNFDYLNIDEIFKIYEISNTPKLGNIFHVLFTPSNEPRIRNNNGDFIEHYSKKQNDKLDAFEIKFGSPDNCVVKSIDVSTEESRPTAESIYNLQRLADKENTNKFITRDCSTLSVMEGRSYHMKVEVIGNMQISPMQYFYVANHPLFSGLYLIMDVTHSITSNNMVTNFNGVKMRFNNQDSTVFGVKPITLEDFGLGDNLNSAQMPGVGGGTNPGVSVGNISALSGIYFSPKNNLTYPIYGGFDQSRLTLIQGSPATIVVNYALTPPNFINPMELHPTNGDVAPGINSFFGMRNYPPYPPGILQFHPGMDLHPQSNTTEIKASADGTIYKVYKQNQDGTWPPTGNGQHYGYGNFVIIKHDYRFFSLYGHMSNKSSFPIEGTIVKQGDVIGIVGDTDDAGSVPIHLHFEIWDKTVSSADYYCAVNPAYYITTYQTGSDKGGTIF